MSAFSVNTSRQATLLLIDDVIHCKRRERTMTLYDVINKTLLK